MRKSVARIYLKNLEFNYVNLRNKGNNRKVMAVVKADAYGHGMVKCVEYLESLKNKPEYYGVALVEEAIELRQSGVTSAPILSFGPIDFDDIPILVEHQIMPTVCTKEHVEFLSDYSGKELKIHINVDTGMGRLGLPYTKAFDLIKRISENKSIVLDGIYTHLACSDENDKSYSKLQLMRFSNIVEKLKSNGIKYGVAHAANSGAVLDLQDSYFDMIRPGISLYGYYPSKDTSESVNLKPVMELVSVVSTTKNIPQGESVSYGRTYIAKQDIVSGTVGFGYADGYNRQLSNRGKGFIGGSTVNQIGRVTMDRIMFDVSEINDSVNKEIILLGKGKSQKFDAADWADICNTIPYEITCNISKRVPREYIR